MNKARVGSCKLVPNEVERRSDFARYIKAGNRYLAASGEMLKGIVPNVGDFWNGEGEEVLGENGTTVATLGFSAFSKDHSARDRNSMRIPQPSYVVYSPPLRGLGKPADGIIQYSQHVEGNGAEFFAAVKMGLEGMVSDAQEHPLSSGQILSLGEPDQGLMAQNGKYVGTAVIATAALANIGLEAQSF